VNPSCISEDSNFCKIEIVSALVTDCTYEDSHMNIVSNCYLLVLDHVLEDDRSICGFMAEKTVPNPQPPEKHLVGNQEHMQCLGINVGGYNNF
jgi:hypothetical protein